MADDEDREAHEQVVTSLLDLQAKLRGEPVKEAPEPVGVTTTEIVEIPEAENPAEDTAGTTADPVAAGFFVEASDVPVLVTPDPYGAAEREEFAPVTTLPVGGASEPKMVALSDRLARIEQEVAQVADRVGSVAGPRDDRTVALEQRLLHEVGSQRADLLYTIQDRFDRLEAMIKEALGDVRVRPDEPEGDEPA